MTNEEDPNPYEAPKSSPSSRSSLASSASSSSSSAPPRQLGLREVPASSITYGLPSVMIHEQRGKTPTPWRLVLGTDELWLVPGGPDDEKAYALNHQELAQHCDITIGNTISWLSLRRVGQRVTLFKLDAQSLEALRRFLAPMHALHVGRALKKRLRFSSPIGLFFIVSSLPILGFKLDPLGLIFGAGLVALSGLASLRSHVSMFLIDAALWVALAVLNLRSVLTGSMWSLAFVALSLFFAMGSVRAFLFYRPRNDDNVPKQ